MKCPGTAYCLSLCLVYLSHSIDLRPSWCAVRRASSFINTFTCLTSSKLQV